MKFIELTCYAGISKRLLLNINNIASICLWRKYNHKKKEYIPVTVIQETTSEDNFWEVTETIDEVIALLRKQDVQVEDQASLKAENAKLQADNISLVEQMNKMALKPNQEVIEWHSYPEEKPEPSRCCIVERKNFCYYIAHHSEIDGWLDSVTFDVLSEVKSWAYLPIGANHE